MRPLFLGCDLDRTLLPNGPQPQCPEVRQVFHALRRRPEVTLAYLTGRSRGLIEEALDRYGLPLPHYAAADVGTTLYRVGEGEWERLEDWDREIAPDWQGLGWRDLHLLLAPPPELRLQEEDRQNRHKLSYYAPADLDREDLFPRLQAALDPAGVRARFVWSVDETGPQGLLDVLPRGANKHHAARFLLERLGIPLERAVVAGDSGNDLALLAGDLQAVLVANATEEVRQEAREAAARSGRPERLYLARGGFLGLNGNFGAGVLEGLAHYLPESTGWIEGALKRPSG